MKIYLSLGSNIGSKREQIKKVVLGLSEISKSISLTRISPLFETPALLPLGAPSDWNKPYVNAVLEMKLKNEEGFLRWNELESEKKRKKNGKRDHFDYEKEIKILGIKDREFKSLLSFLHKIKEIEKKMGRFRSERGSPRPIDIDILYIEGIRVNEPELTIPHKDLKNRSFLLSPLRFLNPNLHLPMGDGREIKISAQLRSLKNQFPLWMGILNVTPDSFSDGGQMSGLESFKIHLKKMEEQNIQVLDLGAESTRPQARALEPKEEWDRLFPYLSFLKRRYQGELIRPLISLDTRFSSTARKALELKGVDWINDVSGLQDEEMISVLQDFKDAKYILVHSLSVPADPKIHISVSEDPVLVLKKWLDKKLNLLEKNKINLNRIIFDPGIGFGKSGLQSLEILRRIKEFHSFPVYLLVGHSRKSFMNSFCKQDFSKRDDETLGVSLWLSHCGVDILRVHNVAAHVRAFRGWSHVSLDPLHLDS